MIVEALAKLVDGLSLTLDEASTTMEDIMEDRATPAQFGAFVTALRLKGETEDEIAGMAQVMRRKALRVPTELPVVDTCGTGGDGSGSFNVSTAAAFVVATAGKPVAKHGNRGMTSKCGSADVLEALGANVALGPDAVARCIEQVGMGFMLATAYHPSMKFAAPLRRELGIRTIFNILGPLTNPAGARSQVLGVADGALQGRMAGALARLGVSRALVVHGRDGLDELSISGPTRVYDVQGSATEEYQVEPTQFGFATAAVGAVRGGTAAENAAIMRAVLSGQQDGAAQTARQEVVALNAGAALLAAGGADTLQDAVRLAADVLRSGDALAKLDDFVRTSQALTG